MIFFVHFVQVCVRILSEGVHKYSSDLGKARFYLIQLIKIMKAQVYLNKVKDFCLELTAQNKKSG